MLGTRVIVLVVLAIALVCPVGCSQPGPDLSAFDQVVLLDVQGLYGGRDLWISADGRAVCRFVEESRHPAIELRETRYEFDVSQDQLSALREALKKHKFSSISIRQRPGVPDEAFPIIFVAFGSQTFAVGKWADDKQRDFDPIYELLLKIAESARQGTQLVVSERGPDHSWDWEWRPRGFPENKHIHDLAKP